METHSTCSVDGAHSQTNKFYFFPRGFGTAAAAALSLARPLLAPSSDDSLLDVSATEEDAAPSSLVAANNSSIKKSGMAQRLLMSSVLQ